MKSLNSKVIVITGGTQGIGRACVDRFLHEGWRVHVIARSNPEAHFQAAWLGERFFFHSLDLTDEEETEAMAKHLLELESGGIDCLLSNAGSGISGSLENTDLSLMQKNYHLHVWGGLLLVQKLLPALRQKQGRIYFMSSLAAEVPIPYQAIYAVAKAGLRQLAYCWDMELKPFGVRVGLIMPGDVHTEFTRNRRQILDDGIYTTYAQQAIAIMARDEENGMSPDSIAPVVFCAVVNPRFKATIIPGLKYRFLYQVWRFLPRRFALYIVRKMYRVDG